jgi:hypothetical protein
VNGVVDLQNGLEYKSKVNILFTGNAFKKKNFVVVVHTTLGCTPKLTQGSCTHSQLAPTPTPIYAVSSFQVD